VAEKAVRILERHGLWYVWIYRYVTGVRTIGAIPVGMTTWPRWRFSLANLGAGTVWAGATTAAGYLFADVWTSDRLQTANLIALGLLLGLMALGWWAWRRLDADYR
jgi:membrane-associated protein